MTRSGYKVSRLSQLPPHQNKRTDIINEQVFRLKLRGQDEVKPLDKDQMNEGDLDMEQRSLVTDI